MRSCFHRRKVGRKRRAGFTLLEVFATLVVLLLALTALMQFMDSVDQSWRTAASDPFAEAESAFAQVTQHLEVATLDPYRDYVDASGAFRASPDRAVHALPTCAALRSRFRLRAGCDAARRARAARRRATACSSRRPAGQTQIDAQAGLDHLLNALGYFVEFGADANGPSFLGAAPRLRWRLKQIAQPSESLQIFSSTTSAPWIAQLAGPTATPAILAENVIALVVLPERTPGDATLAPTYSYDSRDTTNTLTLAQLPPRVRVVLVAIDEASAQQLAAAQRQPRAGAPAAGHFPERREPGRRHRRARCVAHRRQDHASHFPARPRHHHLRVEQHAVTRSSACVPPGAARASRS